MLRKYFLIYDNGHDYYNITFWSKHLAGSKAFEEDVHKLIEKIRGNDREYRIEWGDIENGENYRI